MKSDRPDSAGPRWLRTILLAAALWLALLAAIAFVSGGLRLTLGPLRISATDPYRVLLEAAAVWLVAEVVTSEPRRRRGIPLAIGALLLAGVADSKPMRVGDGAEYVAMALNLSRGQPPSVTPDERESLTNEMGRMPGFERPSLETSLVGRDQRQDFYHFWLYPLIVSPFVLLAEWAVVHVNYAFTAVNLVLLGGLLSWLARRDAPEVAALVAAGPLMWWIDKAHGEVFLFVTLAFAVLLIDTWPAMARIRLDVPRLRIPQRASCSLRVSPRRCCAVALGTSRIRPWRSLSPWPSRGPCITSGTSASGRRCRRR